MSTAAMVSVPKAPGLRSASALLPACLLLALVGCGPSAGPGTNGSNGVLVEPSDAPGGLQDALDAPDGQQDALDAPDGQQDAADPADLSDCVPSGPETCNGLDDDCDGQTDEGDALCDDGDACTAEACVDGACEAGAPAACDDGNPCTQDACDPASGCTAAPVADGKPCDDGDTCTTADACQAGTCQGGPAIDCDDGNPCTDDLCDAVGGCSHAPNTATCQDGNPCTNVDTCQGGACVPGPDTCDCQTDADCAAQVTDLCAGTLLCQTGPAGKKSCVVQPGTAVTCPAATACAVFACAPATGQCQPSPKAEGKACDDGNACTAGDACVQGACQPGGVALCDDGNPCTADACDPIQGCLHTAASGPCDDGNPCTVDDTCLGGACAAGVAKGCDDGDPCTVDACDAKTGACGHPPAADGTSCAAADKCPVYAECQQGQCQPLGKEPCDDANPCTDDACDPTVGCTHLAKDGAKCSDGEPCTFGDLCQGKTCQPGKVVDCDDGNPCTLDICEDDGGCHNSKSQMDGQPCDAGGGLCDGEAVCKKGTCKAEGVVCKDDNPCTDQSCDPAVGCVFPANTASCEDGNLCTLGDTCANKTCQAGGGKACDDASVCTSDSCDPATGHCQFAALPGCGKRFMKAFGGKKTDVGKAVRPTQDGGWIVTGYTESMGAGDRDVLLVKTDACGNPQWVRTYGGKKEDEGDWVEPTKDGGYIIAGGSKTWSGSLVIKTDGKGEVQWSGAYGGGGYDHARRIRQTSDGGYIMVCDTYSFGPNAPSKHSMLVYKLSATGDVVWEHVYAGPTEGDAGWSMVEAFTDGKPDGYAIAGATESFTKAPDDFWLMRLEPDGTIRWNNLVGGNSDDELRDLQQTPDGGFVMTGYAKSYGADGHDIALLKVAADGDLEWMRRYGGFADDDGMNVFVLPDGYVVAGVTRSFNGNEKKKDVEDLDEENLHYDGLLMKTDLDGELQWLRVYGNTASQQGQAAARGPDGGFAITGRSKGYGGGDSKMWLIKTDANGQAGCETVDVDIDEVSTAKVKPWQKNFKPIHIQGAQRFSADVKASTPTLPSGFATGVCPCE